VKKKKAKHGILLGTKKTMCGDKIGKRMLLSVNPSDLTCEHCQNVLMSVLSRENNNKEPEGEAEA
jgi:hypothetical protein